jgi:hypothetical protein
MPTPILLSREERPTRSGGRFSDRRATPRHFAASSRCESGCAGALRKITPTRARARYPQQRVKETSAITARTALAFTAARNELLDLLPLIIPKYFAFQS